MKIIKRTHNYNTMEKLESNILKKIERFNNDFNKSNTDISYIDYKKLNDNILIKCDYVKAEDTEFKHTEIYNLKEKTIICVSGISTLNIYNIPMNKELYK